MSNEESSDNMGGMHDVYEKCLEDSLLGIDRKFRIPRQWMKPTPFREVKPHHQPVYQVITLVSPCLILLEHQNLWDLQYHHLKADCNSQFMDPSRKEANEERRLLI